MLIKLFQMIFGKLIGLDQIPQDKKDKAAQFALKMAEKGIEAAAKGAAEGFADGFKYKIEREG